MLTARLIVPSAQWAVLRDQLERSDPHEDGAFVVLRCARGRTSLRLLVTRVLAPPADAWDVVGDDALRPSARWFSAAIGAAIAEHGGLGFIHSHPGLAQPPTLSEVDRRTSLGWSRLVTAQLAQPFASLVWSRGGVTGMVFGAGSEQPIAEVAVQSLGDGRLEQLSATPDAAADAALDDRQTRALSRHGNARMRNLRIAVVGAGGTGSAVIDQLARLGVREVIAVDPDVVDEPSNLRRLIGATPRDLVTRRRKVTVAARHVRALALGTVVTPVARDVRTRTAARALIDCDAIVATTDTHSSRVFVNQLAYQCWVPTIDVGFRVGTATAGAITGMPVEIRALLPDTGCLWCRGALDPYRVRAETLPDDERRALAAEGYVQAVDVPVPSVAVLNGFAASIAVLTLVRLVVDGIRDDAVQSIVDPWEAYWVIARAPVSSACICSQWRGTGDEGSLPYAGDSR